jgi:hypothetical protein
MRTATFDELGKGGELVTQREPILVLQQGRPIGYFRALPDPDESIPIEVRRELFAKVSEKIRRQLDEKGISEEQIDADIAALDHDRS